MSPAVEAAQELSGVGRDMEAHTEGKLSPDSEQSDSKKDMALPMGLEDDDQGFDLSWLVPCDPPPSRLQQLHDMRGLTDMDSDLLQHFRGPVQYASEN